MRTVAEGREPQITQGGANCTFNKFNEVSWSESKRSNKSNKEKKRILVSILGVSIQIAPNLSPSSPKKRTKKVISQICEHFPLPQGRIAGHFSWLFYPCDIFPVENINISVPGGLILWCIGCFGGLFISGCVFGDILLVERAPRVKKRGTPHAAGTVKNIPKKQCQMMLHLWAGINCKKM